MAEPDDLNPLGLSFADKLTFNLLPEKAKQRIWSWKSAAGLQSNALNGYILLGTLFTDLQIIEEYLDYCNSQFEKLLKIEALPSDTELSWKINRFVEFVTAHQSKVIEKFRFSKDTLETLIDELMKLDDVIELRRDFGEGKIDCMGPYIYTLPDQTNEILRNALNKLFHVRISLKNCRSKVYQRLNDYP